MGAAVAEVLYLEKSGRETNGIFTGKDIVPALRILVFRENGLAFFLATGET